MQKYQVAIHFLPLLQTEASKIKYKVVTIMMMVATVIHITIFILNKSAYDIYIYILQRSNMTILPINNNFNTIHSSSNFKKELSGPFDGRDRNTNNERLT